MYSVSGLNWLVARWTNKPQDARGFWFQDCLACFFYFFFYPFFFINPQWVKHPVMSSTIFMCYDAKKSFVYTWESLLYVILGESVLFTNSAFYYRPMYFLARLLKQILIRATWFPPAHCPTPIHKYQWDFALWFAYFLNIICSTLVCFTCLILDSIHFLSSIKAS